MTSNHPNTRAEQRLTGPSLASPPHFMTANQRTGPARTAPRALLRRAGRSAGRRTGAWLLTGLAPACLALAALLVPASQAQAQSSCAMPSLSGRTQIWTGTVTVGPASIGSTAVSGYLRRVLTRAGDLDDTTFGVGTNNYTITEVWVVDPGEGGAGTLVFRPNTVLETADRDRLELHVCDETFSLDGANYIGNQNLYSWPGNLDWSGETARTRTLRLSVPAPAFPAATATRSVAENTATDQDIGAPFTATGEGALIYTLTGADAASFAIVETTGQLKTKDPLDHETKASYTVTVGVQDNKDSSGTTDSAVDDTITVTISVTNVDEAGAVALSSDPPRVGTALMASVTDPDGTVSNETWQWTSAAIAGGTFTEITGATSDSYTPAAGDVGRFLKATASYTDPQGSGKTAEAVSASATQVALNVVPEFTEGATATREFPETLGSATTVTPANVGAVVAATDTDTGDTLTYTLEGTDADSFGIVSASGQLQTKVGVAYDYETDSSYSVTVKVSDGTDSDTIAVTIDVANLDEAGTVTLTNDGPPRAGTALEASVTDPDGSVSGLTWQWSSADTAADGSFTDITGATSDSYTPVAADVGNFLKATASYDDPQGSGKSAEAVSASATLNVAPEFTEGATATREFPETLGSRLPPPPRRTSAPRSRRPTPTPATR